MTEKMKVTPAANTAGDVREAFDDSVTAEDVKGILSTPTPAPAVSDEKPLIEIWHGNRKVTIYKTEAIRIWGPNIDTEMASSPRNLDADQEVFDWLYADPAVSGDVRIALECARQAIEYSLEMGGTDPGGVLLQSLNKCDAALSSAPAGGTGELGTRITDIPSNEDWVRVPRVPTPEMRAAFNKANEEYENGDGGWSPDYQWQAMLASLPKTDPEPGKVEALDRLRETNAAEYLRVVARETSHEFDKVELPRIADLIDAALQQAPATDAAVARPDRNTEAG